MFPQAFSKMLLAAAAASFLFGMGIVGGVYVLIRPHHAAPVAQDERERLLEDEKRRLAEESKALAQERAKLADDKRHQKYELFMIEGKKCLANKHYDEAIAAFNEALENVPGDDAARNALISAEAGKAGTAALGEDRDKRKADYDKLMAKGAEAMTNKQYALADKLFESALLLLPGDNAALQALADAKTELAKNEIEKKKLADYQSFIEAGNTALNANRYADAIREFLAAQRLLGDATALRGQQDAEKQLALLQNAEDRKKEFFRLLDRSKDAYNAKRYDDALDNALAAQRLMPDDVTAQNMIDAAKKARNDALKEFTRLMATAQNAAAVQQYAQALGLVTQALQLFPNNGAALKMQADLQVLIANQPNVQAANQQAQANQQAALAAQQATYTIFMNVGLQAMQAHHFREAARAFTQALLAVPNDPAATQGLADAQKNIALIDVARTADFDRFMTVAAAAMTKKLYRDAIIAYRDALKAAPDNPVALAGLQQARYLRAMSDGERALFNKRPGEAVGFFKEALEVAPGDIAARDQLKAARYQRGLQDGGLALKEGRYADAIPLLDEALREKPTDATVKDQLRQAKYGKALNDGRVAMNSRRFTDAVAAFQEALREKPNDPTATNLLNQARKGK